MTDATARKPGFLLLEDGTLFHGFLANDAPLTVAEVVFTTNMTGYQEVFTDPSYRGQIVVMTAPMIGNYGVNSEDPESARPQVAAVVVRELSRRYSSWRAERDLLLLGYHQYNRLLCIPRRTYRIDSSRIHLRRRCL